MTDNIKGTQEEQDNEDEKARLRVKQQLIQSWMDRLQLVSVIVSATCSS